MALIHKKPAPTARKTTKATKARFAVCITNEGYQASLEKRKIYQVVPDNQAHLHNLMRVIDESGEDYLYPASWFVPITISPAIAKALALAA